MRFLSIASLALFAISARAQTTTVINDAGQTVVEVITTGAGGVQVINTIQTLTGAATTSTSSAPSSTGTGTGTSTSTSTGTPGLVTVTQPPPPKGPVGQPGPTGAAGGVTPYTYTTVVNGVTETLSDFFTPTFPATIEPTPSSDGTVWNYQSWFSVYGPTSTPGHGKHNAGSRTARVLDTGWWAGLLGLVGGGVGGVWLVMMI